MTILNNCKKKSDGKVTKADLLNALKEYDVLIPRNPLRSIISKEPWSVVAVNRIRTYNPTPGSIGTLFEKEITVPSDYHRVYAVGRATFSGTKKSDLKVGLTGEIDSVDGNGNLVEIKTKGSWCRENVAVKCCTWMQSMLGGVETIVRGVYSQERGNRYGVATFKRENIYNQTIEEFGRHIPGKYESLDYAGDVLRKIVARVKKLGVVYEISGGQNDEIRIIEIIKTFLISKETILNCIAVFSQK
ncbi:hypothetical protein HK098_003617 [Nowakowskiella sp. JEL0407]|nr:hypothetical protein HK098_003617 [Nowakowskiella sp. JEL0407]